MNVGGGGPGGNMMTMNMQVSIRRSTGKCPNLRRNHYIHTRNSFHLTQQQMYGQQQTQQQVQPNQQPMLGNAMGPTRMILQGNRMAVPQTGMMNSGMQQQQPQQPVSNLQIHFNRDLNGLRPNQTKQSFEIVINSLI